MSIIFSAANSNIPSIPIHEREEFSSLPLFDRFNYLLAKFHGDDYYIFLHQAPVTFASIFGEERWVHKDEGTFFTKLSSRKFLLHVCRKKTRNSDLLVFKENTIAKQEEHVIVFQVLFFGSLAGGVLVPWERRECQISMVASPNISKLGLPHEEDKTILFNLPSTPRKKELLNFATGSAYANKDTDFVVMFNKKNTVLLSYICCLPKIGRYVPRNCWFFDAIHSQYHPNIQFSG